MFFMLPNIVRNLVSPRATRPHPDVVRPPFENSRGELINDIDTCTFCGTCAVKCPSQCIRVDRKAAVWHYNPHACVACGVCVESCPSGSLVQLRDYRRPSEELAPVVLQGKPRAGKSLSEKGS